MFGLGWPEVLALVVIALLVFGPEKLPQAAAQAGKTLRQLRQMANNARNDLQENLGPEFRNFDPADLHPKNFVRKHLLQDLEDDWNRPAVEPDHSSYSDPLTPAHDELGYGEIPPYDHEAT
ncbi:sec-independent translocase [Sphaerisporangium fuscum]|uniref:sec-independent translocase n=1 Tax=Sphaerisporangium fuscum TaxID=2835868 RepID=UPI001BDD3070|nr:sec-independent translocase [Sphaerisporangium fuscum]